jgi:hypothetical protein
MGWEQQKDAPFVPEPCLLADGSSLAMTFAFVKWGQELQLK